MSATITALQRKLETDSAAYQTLQKGKLLKHLHYITL